MSRPGRDPELGLKPGPVQRPGLLDGTHHVVAPVHDHAGDALQFVRIVQDLVVAQEGVLHEIVALDARQAQGRGIFCKMLQHFGLRDQVGRAAFPGGPGACGLALHVRIIRCQAPVERCDQVVPLVRRDDPDVRLPQFRVDPTGTLLVKPLDVPPATQEDAAQDEPCNTLRMRLGVDQCKGSPPRATDHQPGINLQVHADAFDIGNKILSSVATQFRMRRGTPAAALIEQDDPVMLRVEEPAMKGLTSGTRTAVQEHDGCAFGIAAFLDPKGVQVRHLELELKVRFDLRIQLQVFHSVISGNGSTVLDGNFRELLLHHKPAHLDIRYAFSLAMPAMPAVRQHMRSLSYTEVPEAIEVVRNSRASLPARACLEFVILTACRSGETRLARWREINFDEHLWIIPPVRMKQGREHRQALCVQAITLLKSLHELRDECDLVFPSPMKKGKPLSDMSLTKVLRDNGLADHATVHGFRSSFRTWASERTDADHAVMELCLAHAVGSAVEQAYARSDLLAKRRRLMDQWGSFVVGSNDRNVVQFHGQKCTA